MRSRASSRCRLANVWGESGAGGRVGSSPSTGASGAAPGCWGRASGGDPGPCAAAVFAIAAGTGGDEEFLAILARAGAASGTFGGGVVGALSWYVVR